MKPLRICLDARLRTGLLGGAEQTVLGLAHGLSGLADGEEEYCFLVHADDFAWLEPYLHGPCRALPGPPAPARRGGSGVWSRRLHSALRAGWHQVSPRLGAARVHLSPGDGTIERAGVEVMHFTLSQAFTTELPNLYNPHDLQHLHFPENFTPRQRMVREVSYRKFCAQADLVCAMTEWGRRDLTQRYGISPEKILLTPWAGALEAYAAPTPADLAATRRDLALPELFLFYPAQTYPHKNHLKLLEALAAYRERFGHVPELVCTGRQSDFFPMIDRHARKLGLRESVHFPGFVTPLQLKSLYGLARLVVFPTKFEGFGLPLIEAFAAGAPVACSRVTCLPEVAGGAALFFDPDRPEDICRALAELWQDDARRAELSAQGRRRAEAFSWRETARVLRAAYRHLARRALNREDTLLLAAARGIPLVAASCGKLRSS